MPCEICGTNLLIGKNNDDKETWCPKCHGIKIVDMSESLKKIGEELKSAVKRKNEIISKFNKHSIIGGLSATLDSLSATESGQPIRCNLICSTSYAIKELIAYENFGEENISQLQLDELLAICNSIFELRFILQSLIHDGYMVGINVPANKINEYSGSLQRKSNQYCMNHSSENMLMFKFTEDWNFNRLVAFRYGIYSNDELDISKEGPYTWSREPFLVSLLDTANYAFQFAAGSSPLFNNLDKDIDLIDTINKLQSDFYNNFALIDTENKNAIGNIWPAKKDEIIYSISEINSNPEEIYDRLLNLNFPLLIDIGNLCFILPNTCHIYLHLLNSKKFYKEINKHRSLKGDFFEEFVHMGLDAYGYEVRNPDTEENLINFYTKEEELDVAGYTSDRSIIIECKHIDIGSNFFKRKSIKKRIKYL